MNRDVRVKELFLAALDQPVARRAAFVAEACGDDERLCAEVRELLRYHGASDPRLDQPLGEEGLLADMPLRLAESPPGYTIERLLGRGGMGTVWLAVRARDQAHVALKLLTTAGVSREMVQRFRREAEILGRLHHPGIARLYEASSHLAAHGEQPFLVLEYVEGETLSEHLRTHEVSPAERLELLVRIAGAVAHAHAQGVVHRDLKPENILITPAGEPRVLDFGVARLAELEGGSLATRTGLLLGTPQYMSPEQVQAEPGTIGPASDVYSLGVIAFEVLSGQLPYDVRHASLHRAVVTVLTVEPPRLGALGLEHRGDVENIVAKALQKRPQDRYPDAAAFADDLRRHLEGRAVSVRTPAAWRGWARGIAQARWRVPVAILLLVLAVPFAWRQVSLLRADNGWREALGRLELADDMVHDQDNRTVERIERARTILEALPGEIMLLPQRPFSARARVYVATRLGEAHWILGDLRSDPNENILALEQFRIARGRFDGADPVAGMDGFDNMRAAFRGLKAVQLAGLQAMTYRELARYRRPAPNFLYAVWALADVRRQMYADAGLPPPGTPALDPPHARAADSLERTPEMAVLDNDETAALSGYGAAADSVDYLDSALARSRHARANLVDITGDAPLVGSVLFDAGLAFLRHAQAVRSTAECDSAATYLIMSLSYRGPERAHQFAETQRTLAELEFERARLGPPGARRRAAVERALSHLADAADALRPGGLNLALETAFLDLDRAQAWELLAEDERGAAHADSAAAVLARTHGVFPSTRFVVQAAWVAYLGAVAERLRWRAGEGPVHRALALGRLDDAVALLPADQDRAFDKRVAAERARLAATSAADADGQPLAGRSIARRR